MTDELKALVILSAISSALKETKQRGGLAYMPVLLTCLTQSPVIQSVTDKAKLTEVLTSGDVDAMFHALADHDLFSKDKAKFGEAVHAVTGSDLSMVRRALASPNLVAVIHACKDYQLVHKTALGQRTATFQSVNKLFQKFLAQGMSELSTIQDGTSQEEILGNLQTIKKSLKSRVVLAMEQEKKDSWDSLPVKDKKDLLTKLFSGQLTHSNALAGSMKIYVKETVTKLAAAQKVYRDKILDLIKVTAKALDQFEPESINAAEYKTFRGELGANFIAVLAVPAERVFTYKLLTTKVEAAELKACAAEVAKEAIKIISYSYPDEPRMIYTFLARFFNQAFLAMAYPMVAYAKVVKSDPKLILALMLRTKLRERRYQQPVSRLIAQLSFSFALLIGLYEQTVKILRAKEYGGFVGTLIHISFLVPQCLYPEK